MATLSKYISVHERFARSANLERDADLLEPLEKYIVTARSLSVVESVAKAALKRSSGGAWSITGPYGSGKSSLALLIDASFGPISSSRELAWDLIYEACPTTGELIRQVHHSHQTEQNGFYRGLVTANREPLSHTLLRALEMAVLRKYGSIPNDKTFKEANTLKKTLEDISVKGPNQSEPSPSSILNIAKCLAMDAPLILIIDEFGKNLEVMNDNKNVDPYLLQQLAEAGQGAGLPIFILTLQHLSFESYAAQLDSLEAREWGKVQGRFENINFVESPQQVRALIGSAFKISNKKLEKKIFHWAREQANVMQSLGISELSVPKTIASYYPLHPLSAIILPELCTRYGQHERSLFSFLTDSDPSSVISFLENKNFIDSESLPSLGLEDVYDYFVGNSATTMTLTEHSSRWIEIATRLRDIQGLSPKQIQIAKSIALLNLISTGGIIRASVEILSLIDKQVMDILKSLGEVGVITYREFSNEYRIWHGTDIDIKNLVKIAYQQIQQLSLVEVLSSIDNRSPVVAAKHSAQYNMLRIFKKRYVEGTEENFGLLDNFSPYDGELLLVANDNINILDLKKQNACKKPVVIAIPKCVDKLRSIAQEVLTLTLVLNEPSIKADWVAKQELEERQAGLQTSLNHIIDATYNSDSCKWILLDSSGNKELPSGRGSFALSVASDFAYPDTPVIQNEMLNRFDLTSQGTKARRILLSAMIERDTSKDLGLKGYGPEVAMYKSFLGQTGIHSLDSRNKTMVFRRPSEKTLLPAWEVLKNEFDRARAQRINLRDVYEALLSPPIGMKAAVVPVFVTAGLLAFSDRVAVYEHGTFVPLLTSYLSERMVRNPSHFDIKNFANTTGARKHLVAELAHFFNIKPGFQKQRVSNVLSIVSYLMSRMKNLDNYSLETSNLTPITLKLRETLLDAVEPDNLLFETLPKSMNLFPVFTSKKKYEQVNIYTEKLNAALKELTNCHDELLNDLLKLLLRAASEQSRLAITGQAAALKDEVLNPSMKTFVLALANDKIDDHHWINAIATITIGKAPTEWQDKDLLKFEYEIFHLISNFQRLVALHAERQAYGGDPFDSLRLTVTRSDGTEHMRLVSVDQSQRSEVETILEKAIDEVREYIGPLHNAESTFLAILGERLMPELQEGFEKTNVASPPNSSSLPNNKEVGHG